MEVSPLYDDWLTCGGMCIGDEDEDGDAGIAYVGKVVGCRKNVGVRGGTKASVF